MTTSFLSSIMFLTPQISALFFNLLMSSGLILVSAGIGASFQEVLSDTEMPAPLCQRCLLERPVLQVCGVPQCGGFSVSVGLPATTHVFLCPSVGSLQVPCSQVS